MVDKDEKRRSLAKNIYHNELSAVRLQSSAGWLQSDRLTFDSIMTMNKHGCLFFFIFVLKASIQSVEDVDWLSVPPSY